MLNEFDQNTLPERKYKENVDVIAFPYKILFECINTLFGKINFMDKFENDNLWLDSTTPLEHTFGRSRINAKDVHTIKKCVRFAEVMFLERYKKKIEHFEKIKDISLSFGVTVEMNQKKW